MNCEVLIDYLTFTVQTDKPDEVIRDYLAMDPDLFADPGYGFNGYTKCKAFSNILVGYEGRENKYFNHMGVCVSMSGKGCRTFETYTKQGATGDKDQLSPFMSLFKKLAGNEFIHVTRLDVACDDHSGFLDMDELRYRYDERLIRTRCSDKGYYDNQKGKDNAGKGLYIGSERSDFRTRIYDKALEQGVDGHWIRVEMVMRGKNGGSFIEKLVDGTEIGVLAAQVLNDKFSFIEKDDCNISRCSTCDWWRNFVQEVEAVRLIVRCAVQHSVGHLADWLRNQVGPTLYIMSQTIGFPSVWQMAEASKARLTPKQKALIVDWRNVQCASALPAG